MGARLLPRNLPELFSYSLVLEREATKRYAELERFLRRAGIVELADEFEKLGREEKEQYELIALGTAGRDLPELAGWELHWYFNGESLESSRAPRTTLDAVTMALAFERRTRPFTTMWPRTPEPTGARLRRRDVERRAAPHFAAGDAPRARVRPRLARERRRRRHRRQRSLI